MKRRGQEEEEEEEEVEEEEVEEEENRLHAHWTTGGKEEKGGEEGVRVMCNERRGHGSLGECVGEARGVFAQQTALLRTKRVQVLYRKWSPTCAPQKTLKGWPKTGGKGIGGHSARINANRPLMGANDTR